MLDAGNPLSPWALPALILHVSAGIAWLLLLLPGLRARPPAWGWRAEAAAAALLSGTAPWALATSGQWLDMPEKYLLPLVIGLSLTLALAGARALPGALAALALAGFWLVLGLVSLHHATPLAPPIAAKAMLTGAALLLLPRQPGRWRTAASALLLAATAMAAPLAA